MHFLLNVFPYLLKSKFVDIMNDRITLAYYRFAKKVMASMFDWVWLPAGALATPTLTKKLKAIDWDVCAARRGGKRSARGTFSQRGGYVGREGEDAKEEDVEELDGEEREGSDISFASEDEQIITWEEME